jgi:hypothetical protein
VRNIRQATVFILISAEQSLIHQQHKASPGAFATSLFLLKSFSLASCISFLGFEYFSLNPYFAKGFSYA